MPTRQVELQFPIAGLDRAWPYQSQPPFSTPDALNVRPFDTLEGRGRGGSRPGLYRYGRPATDGKPLNMLGQLHYVSAAGRQFWRDDFDGTALGPNWSSQHTTITDSLIMMHHASTPWLTYQQNSALLPAESPTKAFMVELLCVPHEGSYAAEYQIVVCVDPSDPDPETDGITITFRIDSDGHWSGTCQQYVAGVLAHDYTLTAGETDTACYPGWLRVKVMPGTSKIDVWWNGDVILSNQAITAPTTNIGWGFGGRATTSGGYANIEAVRYIWQPEAATPIPQVGLIAAANGTCYRTNWLNNWEAMTGVKVSPTEMLQAAEHGGKLYIADHGVGTISGENAYLLCMPTYILLTDDVTAPFASVTTSDFVVITASSTGQWRGTYPILEVMDASHLKLDGKLPSLPSDAFVSYSIANAPRVANLNLGTVAVWTATTGSVPANCPIIFAYADRIVLAGSPPEFWYMSRKGDPYDWNSGIELTDDPAAAVFGTLADAGQRAGAITAGVAFSDDYAILATATQIWIMRGDPGYGGSLDCVSRTVGIVGRFALCQTPEQELVFLSRDGLYLLAPGGSAYPVPLSRDKLPLELRDLSSDRYTVQMAYDVRDRGVHIFITGNPALDGVPTGDRSHWWFDWPTKSFWPVTFDSHDYDPASLLTFEAGDAREAGPLLGCADGYIRQFYRRAEGDDTARMTNWVYYGPIRLGPNGYDGILHEMIATLGENSGPVAWEVYVGDTPQDAIRAAKAGTVSPAATGTWSAEGLNYNTLVRRRGAAMILKLKNDTTTYRRWTVENLIARIQPGGPVRKA